MMNTLKLFSSLFFLSFLLSCQQEPAFQISTEEFLLQPGFAITPIAAEPLLDAPVAMTFDLEGRIWVVELPGYMRDIDGSEEQKADGRIVVLEDTNADGQMDKRTVFMDNLVTPRALLFAYGGLLYTENTSLMWVKINGKKAGETVLVDSLYVVGGNIEHQPNGLLYHLDNHIYSANSKARYIKKGDKWIKEATKFRGQWGLSQDADGRLIYNNNSLAIATDFMMPNQLIANEYQAVKFGYSQDIAPDRRLHGIQATAVNRGYIDGVLDEEGKIKELTSACSPFIYLGDDFSDDFYGDGFVCAPEANLIKRYNIEEKGVKPVAIPAYENTEFLISKDETFRPVNLYNAPDGSLYILDLRKGIIQHRAYMTNYLREKIQERGLEKITGKGRIYKVTSGEIGTKIPDLNSYQLKDFVPLLQSENGYLRLLAQQKLVESQDKSLKSDLEKIAFDRSNPYGQIHALWTLQGLAVLDGELLIKATAKARHPKVVAQLIRLTEFVLEEKMKFIPFFQKAVTWNEPLIDLQLLPKLAGINNSESEILWKELLRNYSNHPVFCEAFISGIDSNEEEILTKLIPEFEKDSIVSQLKKVIENKQNNASQYPKYPTETFKDNRTAGFDLFSIHCASCHGIDGKGKNNLAPPMVNSEFVSGPKEKLILLVLNGLKGPIHVNGELYDINLVMPGIKHNPMLTDKDIADILIFVRNSFSKADPWMGAEDVTKWREATKDRTELFTEKELEEFEIL